MKPRLVALAGHLTGSAFELEEPELAIGRDSSNRLIIRDSSVSRRHCVIVRDGDRFRIVDLGSRHGTRVNGEPCTNRLLDDDDRIALGRSVFVFLAGVDHTDSTVSITVADGEAIADETRHLPVGESLLLNPERVLAVDPTGDRARADLEILRRISAAIQSISSSEPLALKLLELIFEVVPASRGGVLLLADGDGLELAAIYSHGRASGPEQRVAVSRTVAEQVVRDRVAVLSNGVRETSEWAGAQSLESARVRSVLCVPMALFERVIGVIYLDSSRSDARFDERHLELVTAIAGIAAMPLASAWRASAHPIPGGDEPTTMELSLERDLAGLVEATEPPVFAAPTPVAGDAGSAVLVFRPESDAHLGTLLTLRAALALYPERDFPRLALFLDYGQHGTFQPGAPLPMSWIDRLAALPGEALPAAARATDVPALARLAAQVAATLRPRSGGASDARGWFHDILIAAGLVVTRAAYATVEPAPPGPDADPERPIDPGADLELARHLGSRINKVAPDLCPRPSPLVGGVDGFRSLDGAGAMGTTAKGAILLSDSADTIRRKLRTARTDARPALDPEADLSSEVRNLLLLYHALTGEPTTVTLDRFAGKGYGILKAELADVTTAYLEPIRRRREELVAAPELANVLASTGARLERMGARIAAALSQTPL